jgi:hypothetical protein
VDVKEASAVSVETIVVPDPVEVGAGDGRAIAGVDGIGGGCRGAVTW